MILVILIPAIFEFLLQNWPKQNYCQILVKCSWLVCQHLEFENGTLGAMINEFAFEF